MVFIILVSNRVYLPPFKYPLHSVLDILIITEFCFVVTKVNVLLSIGTLFY